MTYDRYFDSELLDVTRIVGADGRGKAGLCAALYNAMPDNSDNPMSERRARALMRSNHGAFPDAIGGHRMAIVFTYRTDEDTGKPQVMLNEKIFDRQHGRGTAHDVVTRQKLKGDEKEIEADKKVNNWVHKLLVGPPKEPEVGPRKFLERKPMKQLGANNQRM